MRGSSWVFWWVLQGCFRLCFWGVKKCRRVCFRGCLKGALDGALEGAERGRFRRVSGGVSGVL